MSGAVFVIISPCAYIIGAGKGKARMIRSREYIYIFILHRHQSVVNKEIEPCPDIAVGKEGIIAVYKKQMEQSL